MDEAIMGGIRGFLIALTVIAGSQRRRAVGGVPAGWLSWALLAVMVGGQPPAMNVRM
jgi:hypothetical protein